MAAVTKKHNDTYNEVTHSKVEDISKDKTSKAWGLATVVLETWSIKYYSADYNSSFIVVGCFQEVLFPLLLLTISWNFFYQPLKSTFDKLCALNTISTLYIPCQGILG